MKYKPANPKVVLEMERLIESIGGIEAVINLRPDPEKLEAEMKRIWPELMRVNAFLGLPVYER